MATSSAESSAADASRQLEQSRPLVALLLDGLRYGATRPPQRLRGRLARLELTEQLEDERRAERDP